MTRRVGLIVTVAVALVAIFLAWFAGAGFVAHQSNGASLSMALSSAVAMLCYAIILLVTPARGRA